MVIREEAESSLEEDEQKLSDIDFRNGLDIYFPASHRQTFMINNI